MKLGKKRRLPLIGALSFGLLLSTVGVLISSKESKLDEVQGYSAASLPTTIDLNDTSASNIRSYYSSLNNLSQSERQGNNLLKNLKTILKNGQKYFSYESGENVWKMYEITDRDWDKSPASSISGYNSSTKKISGYSYNSSNPYLHAFYINRDVDNQTQAWGNHNQDQWGINREHLWPKAEGFDSSGAGGARGDPRHLVAANGYANNIHSNYYYGYVKTSSSYTDCGSKYSNQSGNLRGTSKTLNTGTVFEPQDCDKGDIARSIFYMAARYNYFSGSDSDGIGTNNPNLVLTQNISDWESSGYTSTTSNPGKLGLLTDMLNWHHMDPVDEYEIHRNNLLYTNFTNNRNPFVDFPEWVDFIWGTAVYNGTTYKSYSSTPTGYATPSSDTINGYNGGSTDPIAVTGVSLEKNATSIAVGSSEVLSFTVSPYNATNQAVTWTSSNTNVATVSSSGRVDGVTEGNATITVRTSDGGFTATCAVTITASGGGGQSEGTEEGSVTAASGALEGWTSVGAGTAYADGSVKLDGSGDNVYKTDIFSGDVSSGMTSLTVTINGKINGTPTAANSYKVEALDSNGDVLASDVKTGASIVTTSYGDTVFTIDSGLTGCTGIKVTYVTKGGGNWGVKSVSWSAEYSTGGQTATLDSITLDTSDAPTTFNVGDTFSYEGLAVTANYDDGTSDIISSGYTVTTPSLSSAGQKTVTVSYTQGGVTKSASYTITVNAVTLESIEVSDAKTAYYVGDTFVKPTVTATFSNGSTSDVTNSATFSGYNLSNAGNQTVSVSYTNGTTVNTSYSITVTALAVTSIDISGYTTTFTVGDTFSYGGTVIANYNNGSSADVTASATYSGYNMSTAGNQTVTVSFGGQSQTYQIVVSESGGGATDSTQYALINSTSDLEAGKSYIITNGISGTVKAIAVTNNANNRKTTSASISDSKITRGSSIMSFTLGGSSGAWTFATENYAGTDGYLASAASGKNNYLRVISTAGTATISFSSDEAVINIGPHTERTQIRYNSSDLFACYSSGQDPVYLWKEVQTKVLSSISLDTTNVQKTFTVGDTFNYTGLVVTANYADSTSATVSPTNVSSPDMSSTGNKNVTVTYTENAVSKTANYSITVNSNPSISWTAPTINVYSGSTLIGSDVNGWAVTYNDGAGHQTVLTYSQLTVKLGGTTISIPHTWSADDDGKTLTATYNSLTTSQSSAVQVTQSIRSVMMETPGSSSTSDLTFTAACGGSGTADDGKTWTVTSDGTESSFDSQNGKGIHYGTNSAAVQYIKLTSNDFTSGKITKVEVNASTASGVKATVSVKVGGTAFGGEAQTLTSSAVPDNPYTFEGNVDADSVEVLITKPSSATKAIYCKSVVVTYSTSSTSVDIANNVDHIEAQRLAVLFAKTFNGFMDDTEYCTTGLNAAWASCSSAYTLFKSSAASLGETEEAWTLNLIKYATAQYSDDSGEACIERMLKTYEVCVQKHGLTPFMNDLVTVGKAPNPIQITTISNTNNVMIIIVLGVVAISAVGGYFYLRRREQK